MIPGFEAGILSMLPAEDKVIEVIFPEDYHNKELAGQAVTFDIHVHEVQQQQLPDLDQALFQQFGSQCDNLDDFKQEVRTNMEREARQAIREQLRQQVGDALVTAIELDVPKALIKDEMHQLKHQAVQRLGRQMDPHALPDSLFEQQAWRRAKLGLIMSEVIKQYQLQATPEAVRQFLADLAAAYNDPQSVIDYYYSNQQLLDQVEATVLEESVIDYILEQSQRVTKSISYQQAVKPDHPSA